MGQLPIARVSAEVTANQLYELHNQERSREGLSELSINSDLIESATRKAEAMLRSDCWSHFCPEGKSPWDFFDDAGYDYIYAGENLAEGFNSNEEVMSAWMNSPTHRANVLKNEFDEVGIGFATGTFQGIANNTIIVVHFGSRHELTTLPNTVGGTSNSKLIEILSPKQGQFINQNSIDISGKTIENTTVEIDHNGNIIGSVDAEGSNFIYRSSTQFIDGEHKLKATAIDKTNKTVLGESDSIDFTIDTIAPNVVPGTIKVDSINFSNDNFVIITLKTQGNPNIVRYLGNNKTFQRIDENNWELELEKDELTKTTNFTVEATDKAGNSSRAEIPSQTLARNIDELESKFVPGNTTSSGLIASLFDNFADKGVQVQVNILFILFLATLFGIDFYVINKSGLTGLKRGKPHLHLAGLVVLLIISIIGGLGGGILTGLQIAN